MLRRVVRRARTMHTRVRSVEVARAVDQAIDQAGVPALAGVEPYFEAEPPVGIACTTTVMYHRLHRTHKVFIAIGGAQTLLRVGPLGTDMAAPYNPPRLHVEHVGEIAARGDLQIEPHRIAAMVGDVEVLVQAAIYGAAERKG